MQDYSYKNWKEYEKSLGQFPEHKKENPFKIEDNDRRGIRQNVNYFAKAASIAHGNNPTFVTPTFRQQITATNANTQNAQYDQAKRAQDAQFAQSGMYGQGAHKAADNALAAQRAQGMAKVATDTKTQLDQTEFNNWNDWARQNFAWLNQMDDYTLQDKSLELQRLKALWDKKAQEQAANQVDWGSILTGGLGALGAGAIALGA